MKTERTVSIPLADAVVEGVLDVDDGCTALVLFAHGSGSSRHSPRNRHVASRLRSCGLATLPVDLLTAEEEIEDRSDGRYRFDLPLLSRRLVGIIDWVRLQQATSRWKIGLFGASTGAAAALIAAWHRPYDISAIVSRGGRPDLADPFLRYVVTPTLLIVGSDDTEVLALNRAACKVMTGPVRLEIVPGATHLFTEPGALDKVAELAGDFFAEHLRVETASINSASA